METINVTNTAAGYVDILRTPENLARVKAALCDLYAFALADISKLSLTSENAAAIEELTMIVEMINELGKSPE